MVGALYFSLWQSKKFGWGNIGTISYSFWSTSLLIISKQTRRPGRSRAKIQTLTVSSAAGSTSRNEPKVLWLQDKTICAKSDVINRNRNFVGVAHFLSLGQAMRKYETQMPPPKSTMMMSHLFPDQINMLCLEPRSSRTQTLLIVTLWTWLWKGGGRDDGV